MPAHTNNTRRPSSMDTRDFDQGATAMLADHNQGQAKPIGGGAAEHITEAS
jgi:hypothetical protein